MARTRQSKKNQNPPIPLPNVDDALVLQCIQELFGSQETGVTLPTDIKSVDVATTLARSVLAHQDEHGPFLANIGAAVYRKALEMLMESELTAHLGYGKYERPGTPSEGLATTPENASECPSEPLAGAGTGQPRRNYRNGSYTRKVRTSTGTIDIQCPRDRNGTFDSVVLPKGVKDVTGMQEKLLLLVARGNDQRTVAQLIKDIMGDMGDSGDSGDIMGVDVSHEYIRMTIENFNKTLDAWQNRQLKPCYPFLFIDCIDVPFRDDKHTFRNRNRNRNNNRPVRPVYVVLGIDPEGRKELVHIEMGGASLSRQDRVNIFDSLRARGLEEVLFVSMDGVTGVADGLKVIYPKARTFRCIVPASQ